MNYNIGTRIEIFSKDSNFKNILILDNFISLSIIDDISDIVGKASIIIPSYSTVITGNTLVYQSKEEILRLKQGDKVHIYYTYIRNDEELNILDNSEEIKFIGYIKQFNKSEEEIDIIIEDSMYLFKTKKLKTSYENINIETLLLSLEGFYETKNIINISIGNQESILLSNVNSNGYMNGVELLRKIMDEYPVFFYIKLINNIPTLFGGLKYMVILPELDIADFNYPFIEGTYPIISNNIENSNIVKETDLIVIGSSKQINNSIITISTIDGIKILKSVVKDKDKEKLETNIEKLKENKKIIKEFSIPETDEILLTQLVLDSWNNYEDGFTGTFTTFTEPHIIIGDTITIGIDNVIERHYVDIITTTIDINNGLIREITLGTKLKRLTEN